MIRVETVIHTPFESSCCRSTPVGEFSFKLNYRRTGTRRRQNLIIGANDTYWPIFHVTAWDSKIWLGWSEAGDWKALRVEHGSTVSGSTFGGTIKLATDNMNVELPGVVEPIHNWSIGTSPLFNGISAYGKFDIWDVDIRSATSEVPDVVPRNLNYAIIDRFSALLSEYTDPALLKIDVDNLGLAVKTNQWPDATPVIQQMDTEIKLICANQRFESQPYCKAGGSDEFLVLVPGAYAMELAETIRQHVATTSYYERPAGEITVSCGIGTNLPTVTTLYAMAGIAMKKAKRSGKNKVMKIDNDT